MSTTTKRRPPASLWCPALPYITNIKRRPPVHYDYDFDGYLKSASIVPAIFLTTWRRPPAPFRYHLLEGGLKLPMISLTTWRRTPALFRCHYQKGSLQLPCDVPDYLKTASSSPVMSLTTWRRPSAPLWSSWLPEGGLQLPCDVPDYLKATFSSPMKFLTTWRRPPAPLWCPWLPEGGPPAPLWCPWLPEGGLQLPCDVPDYLKAASSSPVMSLTTWRRPPALQWCPWLPKNGLQFPCDVPDYLKAASSSPVMSLSLPEGGLQLSNDVSPRPDVPGVPAKVVWAWPHSKAVVMLVLAGKIVQINCLFSDHFFGKSKVRNLLADSCDLLFKPSWLVNSLCPLGDFEFLSCVNWYRQHSG